MVIWKQTHHSFMHPTFISINKNCQGYIPFNQKRIILSCLNQDKPGRHSLMLLWFKDLMNLTEEVTIHRPNVSTLLSSTFIEWQMARQKPSSVTAKDQLQLVTLLMKGSQRLVLLLFLTFRVLQNPSREFWIATTLKLLKNLFRLCGIFSLNLRILSRKNNEPTPFMLFLAMTVTTNTSDRPTSVWYTFERASKSGFLSQKGRFSFIGVHMPNWPYNWVG